MSGEIDTDDNEALTAWDTANTPVIVTGENPILSIEYDGADIRTGLVNLDEEDEYDWNLPISIGFTDGYTLPTSWGVKCDSVVLSGTEMENVTLTNVILPIHNVINGEHWITGVIDLNQLISEIPEGAVVADFDYLQLFINSIVIGSTPIEVVEGALPYKVQVTQPD